MTMKFGEATISDVKRRIEGLLRSYLTSISDVYERDGEIKIALAADVKMENGQNKVKVGIKFTTEKVDDTSSGYVSEAQVDLFADDATNYVPCPVRQGDRMSETYCAEKCDLRREKLIQQGAEGDEEDFIQFRPCSAWSDHDTHASVFKMLQWEPAPKPAEEEKPVAQAKVYPLKKKRGAISG